MTISKSALLGSLDGLPYRRRMQRLARSARDLDTGVLDELAAGSAYERRLGVTAAAVTGDRRALTAAVYLPDLSIRSTALRELMRSGAWHQPLWPLVADAPLEWRRLVYRALRRQGTDIEELTADLVPLVRERFGDNEAAALLPAVDRRTARSLLPQVVHAVGSWSAVVDRHPDVVLDWAGAVLAEADPNTRIEWWWRHGHAVVSAGRTNAVTVLDLLERYAPATTLPGRPSRYGPLAKASPERLLRLLTAPSRRDWLRRTVLPFNLLYRLRDSDLTELARGVARSHLPQLLRAVQPARRGPLYDAAADNTAWDRGETGADVVDVLPRWWQEREARRVLRLDHVRGDEGAVRRWTAYLPWPEALPVLLSAVRSADADERVSGYRLLIRAARRSGDAAVVLDMLTRLERLRNEQDPVRSAAFEELAGVARSLTVDAVAPLTRLAVDATEARDTSSITLAALGRLAAGVLQHHVGEAELVRWALQSMERIFGGHRLPYLEPFDRTLRRGQETLLFAQLREWIEAGMKRGDFTALFAVTRALRRRAWNLPELQELLRRGIDRRQVSTVVHQSVELWLADPRARDARVGYVLDVDSSTVTLSPVWAAICSRRTDLLDRVLGAQAPTGKFLTRTVRWVPAWPAHVERWLPRQHEAYAGLLDRVAADPGAPMWQRAAAIAAAARVPGVGHQVVLRYVDSTNVALAEAALGALAWTGRPEQALPVLLGYADTDRARVALYAAGRAARFVAPSQLPALLGPLALGQYKITSRKEALRLLAAYGPTEIDGLLLTTWRQPGQHRDVRAAVVSGARRMLHRSTTWTILEEAARGGREDVSAVLALGPQAMAAPSRPRYAGLVVAACRSGDPVVARAAFVALAGWARWAPDVTGLLVDALTDLADHHVWQSTPTVVGALLDHPSGPATLNAVLGALVGLDGADHAPDGPLRDRPARRRLEHVMREAEGWARRTAPDTDVEPVREVARQLAAHPGYVPQVAGLLAALLRRDAPELERLIEIVELIMDRPVLADRIGRQLRDDTSDVDVLLTRATTLARRSAAAAGLVAAGLARAGSERDWPEPWRLIVATLRAHADTDVCDAGYAITMTTSLVDRDRSG